MNIKHIIFLTVGRCFMWIMAMFSLSRSFCFHSETEMVVTVATEILKRTNDGSCDNLKTV